VLASTGILIAPAPGGAAEAAGHGDGAAAKAAGDATSAIKSFKHDGGIKVELFAHEPQLANPVAFTVDEQGRWYIAESYRQERGVEDNRGHGNWLNDDIASRSIEDRLAMIKKFYPDPEKFAEKFTKYEERITRLVDSNGDGKIDQATIYADGFRDPLDGTGAGILARGNDVWWTCIPNLWRFSDTSGDGKADAKEKLLTGFGVKYALRGHDMHGLRFGPDGKLYFSIGDRGLNVASKEGKQWENPDTGSIMRCNPDGTEFEIFATGVRNPQELAFNEFGDLFTGDNNSDAGDKGRFVHLVEGGDCGWRMGFQYINDRGPWNRELLWDEKEGLKAKYLIPPVANLSNGPSGLTYNPGTALSDKYRGHFFLSDFRGGANASVVHDIAVEQQGAWYRLKERRDFVKGILTTDCEFGPDGSLYVLDWVESWGGSEKGRIYKFTAESGDKNLQRETQKLLSEGFEKRSKEQLGKLLGHADQRVRQGAQFALAKRGDEAAQIFTQATQSNPNTLLRLHGIWGLGQVARQNLTAANPLLGLLNSGNPEVRGQAAKVLGELRIAAAGERLTELLRDQSTRVRYFSAQSLGKLKRAEAVEPLFAMLRENNDRDPVLRHGGVMGLAGCATPEQLAGKAADGSVAVRAAAVVALRHLRHPAIAQFLNDADRTVVLEAARAIYDAPIEEAIPALAGVLTKKDFLHAPRMTSHDELQTRLHILWRAASASYRVGTAESAQQLAAFAADNNMPDLSGLPEEKRPEAAKGIEAARRDALDALAAWENPSARDRVLNVWRPLPPRGAADAIAAAKPAIPSLLRDSPGSVQAVAAGIAAKFSLKEAGEPLLQLASNDKAGSSARIAALKALTELKDDRIKQAAKAAVADKDPRVRAEGLQALAAQDPVAAVKVIAEIIHGGASAVEKQGAVLALTQIQRPEANTLLIELMEQLIAARAPAEIQLEIYEAAKKSEVQEIKERLSTYREGVKAADELAQYKLALAGGDVDRGRKLFREKAEVQCLRCHKAEIGDSTVGPDLTKIGAQKDRTYLLESIIFPNKHIAEGFQTVVLSLKDGNVAAGRVASEDQAGVKIETIDDKGKPQTVTIPTAQIQERISAPSPMPENIRDQLSRAELRDLVEYLATRK
jgi:quinoprotein glucose dehydrogenase